VHHFNLEKKNFHTYENFKSVKKAFIEKGTFFIDLRLSEAKITYFNGEHYIIREKLITGSENLLLENHNWNMELGT
jgi:hypothetical protein